MRCEHFNISHVISEYLEPRKHYGMLVHWSVGCYMHMYIWKKIPYSDALLTNSFFPHHKCGKDYAATEYTHFYGIGRHGHLD
jgi:hypothetical protein